MRRSSGLGRKALEGHRTAGDTWRRAAARRGRRALLLALAAAIAATSASAALAQSGLQMTPDGKRTLVSKDVAGQRWAIARDPGGTVTGNVFIPGGGPPQFVWCRETSRTGGQVGLACSGADACPLTPCESDEWLFIADVTLPETFFGAPARASAAASADGTLVAPGAGGASVRPALLLREAASGLSASTAAVQESSGLQLTPEGPPTLISKDVGAERWAISRNEDGTVTGNVFYPGGGAPKFVWCEPAASSGDPVALRCFGADPCPGDASTCDAKAWTLIAEVSLPASFFQPRNEVSFAVLSDAIVAALGEDGGFDAFVLALDRGYDLRQIARAALSGRLRASGEIAKRSGTIEPPVDPPLGLFTDDTSRISARTLTLADLRDKFNGKGTQLGHTALRLVLILVNAGYPVDQIVEHLIAERDITLGGDDGVPALLDDDGKRVTPRHPPRGVTTRCGDKILQRAAGEFCDFEDFGGARCRDFGFSRGDLVCTPSCTIDSSRCTNNTCNDNQIDPGEECDGNVFPTGQSCLLRGFGSGSLTCNDCKISTASCRDPFCGNKVTDIIFGEQCDDKDLGGQSCQTQGFRGGELRCSPTCQLDKSACTNADPGCSPQPASGAVAGAQALYCDGTCIPDGSDCCEGEGAYCPAGSVCVGGRRCCPSSQPQRCGETCTAAGALCCDAGTKPCKGECIPADAACCGNGNIEPGEQCDGADLGGAACEGGTIGAVRCTSSCTLDRSDCGCSGFTCGSTCAPAGADCCEGQNRYCNPGNVCAADVCCPTSNPSYCSGKCFPEGTSCCGPGHVCPPGWVCTGNGCCPASDPVACGGYCYPSGSVCCGDYACAAGSACAGHNQCSTGGGH